MGFQINKTNVLDKIGVYRALQENFPNIKTDYSFLSAKTNAKDVIPFLIDVLKTVEDKTSVFRLTEEFMDKHLDKMELSVKKALLKGYRKVFAKGSDPDVSSDLENGFDVSLKLLDPFNILKIDPSSNVGKLLYSASDKDLNYFLKTKVIPNQNSPQTWQGMLDITYIGSGKIRVVFNSNYATPKKKFSKYAADYLAAVDLFKAPNTLAMLCDLLSGTVAKELGKSASGRETEAQIYQVISSFIERDETEAIDDSFFDFGGITPFGTPGLATATRTVDVGCGIVEGAITFPVLYSAATSPTLTVSQRFEVIASSAGASTPSADAETGKVAFYEEALKGLPRVFAAYLFSPKVFLYLYTTTLMQATRPSYDDSLDFIKKNRHLMNEVVREIYGVVVRVVYTYLRKRVMKLVKNVVAKLAKEKAGLYTASMRSLISGGGSSF